MADTPDMSYEFDSEPWWPEVRKRYGVNRGEAVRFIGPTRAPVVSDYIGARRDGNRNLPDVIVMFWDTQLNGWPQEQPKNREEDVLVSEMFSFCGDAGGFRLGDIPSTLCKELSGGDVRIAGNLSDIVVKGDWCVAADAPLENKLKALESILSRETGIKVHIAKTSTEQAVIVARGTLVYKAIPNPPAEKGIYLYGDSLGERLAEYESEDSLEGLVRSLSDHVHIPVVNEARDPHEGQYRGICTMPSAQMAPGEADTPEGTGKLAVILQNLTNQTGLEFTTERRSRTVWNVTPAED